MSVFEKLKLVFRQGDALVRLIYINTAVFVVLKILVVLYQLFNSDGSFLVNYLAVPARLDLLLYRAWTPLSYMFLHEGVLHFLFNMMALFWFGKVFLMHFSQKQLVGLYLIGGLSGAALYLLAYNVFPYFTPFVHNSLLLGASASIMAVILASAVRSPNMTLPLMFLGSVKLKYIALFFVLTSFFGITSDNGGGQLAHLGGALAGYLFVVSLQNGKDLTRGLNRILDAIFDLFRPGKLKVKQTRAQKKKTRMTDADYNANKVRNMVEIDKILDKIKTSGYESLTADEKKRLFDQSNKR